MRQNLNCFKKVTLALGVFPNDNSLAFIKINLCFKVIAKAKQLYGLYMHNIMVAYVGSSYNAKLFLTLALTLLLISPAKALLGFGKNNTRAQDRILKPKALPNKYVQIAPQDLLYKDIDKASVQEEYKQILPTEVLLDIVADQIEYDQEKTYYQAIGNAEAILKEKDAHLFADRITYDSEKDLLEAFGNISIEQDGGKIYGSYIAFNTVDNKYSMSDPKFFAKGVKLKARAVESDYTEAKKQGDEAKKYLTFTDGVAALDSPISLYQYAARRRTRYSTEIVRYNRKRELDWNDLSDKSNLRYSAKEIYFDNTRQINNLSIKGARIWITDDLSIPSPVHITTTAGEAAGSQFRGPIIGTRERIGGFALGPRFFHEIEQGIFSLVPIVQFGNGPEFGAGAVASFNTPGDKFFVMAGYGSLDNRPIGSFHYQFLKYFEANALLNQFNRGGIFGTSQVGQLYELVSQFRWKLPFIDSRGLGIKIGAGWAKDNAELFTNDRIVDLSNERDDGPAREEHDGFRSELEAQFYTQPLWRYGNSEYNVALRGRAQGALRFYDTGDLLSVGRAGPALEARISNFAFELDYLFAAINGESPFLFDQFVDGSQSVIFDGDYTVNKWFSIGSLLTYNVDRERLVRNQVRTELGPQDFKLRLSYDIVRNQIDIGFNILYGEPVAFDKLKVRI